MRKLFAILFIGGMLSFVACQSEQTSTEGEGETETPEMVEEETPEPVIEEVQVDTASVDSTEVEVEEAPAE